MLQEAPGQRACRLSINVVEVNVGTPFCNPEVLISVEDAQVRLPEVKDAKSPGLYAITETRSFGVSDEARAAIEIGVIAKPFKGLGKKSLVGKLVFRKVSEFLNAEEGLKLNARWYDLFSKDGRTVAGRILLHIVAARAPPSEELKIFVGSWNVGNACPHYDLSPWLPTEPHFELVVVSTQECLYPPRDGFKTFAEDWIETLRDHFGRRYELVKSFNDSQLWIAIFALHRSLKAITDVQVSSIGGLFGPKRGTIAVSLKYWDTSLCFINSHFPSAGAASGLNAKYQAALGSLRLGEKRMDVLNQFHHVFWMGTLNYRHQLEQEVHAGDLSSDEDEKEAKAWRSKVATAFRSISISARRPSFNSRSGDSGCSEDEEDAEESAGVWMDCVRLLRHGKFEKLLVGDELVLEMKAKRCFVGFREAEISFLPTFRLQRGGGKLAYATTRMPSWTDRILWKSLPDCESLRVTDYSAGDNLTTSDHKPVALTVELTAHALPRNAVSAEHKTLAKGDDWRWHVHFEKMKGENFLPADCNGLSDPYVKFIGDNLLKETSSKVKYKTLNPSWGKEDLPPLVLAEKSLDCLRKEYLLVSIFDHDRTNLDDPIGYAVIPLLQAVQASSIDRFVSFSAEVTYKGLYAGTIEGKYRITWEVNTLSDSKCAQM